MLLIQAPINKIIDHTLVDGPGNRTAIFFQACNIACNYCHNPETQRLCCHCGLCVDNCPVKALELINGRVVWNRRLCVNCDSCIKTCLHYSSPKIELMSVEEIFAAVKANIPFIRGITVSGGECSLYLPFLRELFLLCRQIGLTCLIDSNGTVPLWEDSVMEVCNGIMLDVKSWSDECFFAVTGGHNVVVKENVYHLSRMNKLTEVRVVCLEGWVDAEAVITGVAGMIPESVRKSTCLKLIRFRNNGVTGLLSQAKMPSPEYMDGLRIIAEKCGYENIRVV